jgi:hypothetical protein
MSMTETLLRTCVAPSGEFVYGIHKPRFTALNLRETDAVLSLGQDLDHQSLDNKDNYPEESVQVDSATWVFEVPNAFPFMGATYIIKAHADQSVGGCNPFQGLLARPSEEIVEADLEVQSKTALLALARTCTDADLLAQLAEESCRFTYDDNTGKPTGMVFGETETGEFRPVILERHLFELVSNNPHLPDDYKRLMVLNPGVQGKSPIVGEYGEGDTHIWEYLRANSYIPWGHYAANMAHDAVRYKTGSLTESDMTGLRHLYYQRIYVQLAAELALPVEADRRPLKTDELEEIRLSLVKEIEKRNKAGEPLPYNSTIWGQNYGFDFSPSGYRLSASHQQIHQQFALVSPDVPMFKSGENQKSVAAVSTYAQSDMVAQFGWEYRKNTGRPFFDAYLEAIQNNSRMDGRAEEEGDLVVYQDEATIAFVPKAQRSQGEIQILTRARWGNIIELDTRTRRCLDRAILLIVKMLENLGVEMFTAYEIAKRFDNTDTDQRLLYCFLPRHPQSPGGFSESQQRWISNHYPEDFAKVCRQEFSKIIEGEP